MSAITEKPGSDSSVPDGGPGPGRREPTPEERAAAAAVLQMIWGLHVSRALYAVTELGVADRLADGPMSCAELAAGTGTHEPSLYRVLRLLVGLGVFSEVQPGSFGLTVLGDRLRAVQQGPGPHRGGRARPGCVWARSGPSPSPMASSRVCRAQDDRHRAIAHLKISG